MNDLAARRASEYLNEIPDQGGIPDALYLAILDHHESPEAAIAEVVLVFHRDIGNGGLAAAMSNSEGEVTVVLQALEALSLSAVRRVVEDATALYRSLPEKPVRESDGWLRYTAAHDAAENAWRTLDERYRSATYLMPGGKDQLEATVLSYARAHAAAFAPAVQSIGLPDQRPTFAEYMQGLRARPR